MKKTVDTSWVEGFVERWDSIDHDVPPTGRIRVPELRPGEHLAIVSDSPQTAIEARLAGLQIRDTILVLCYGPRTEFVFLVRKPLVESSTLRQVIKTGSGVINIDAARVPPGKGRWPANVVLLHGPTCVRSDRTSPETCGTRCPAHWLNTWGGYTRSSDDPERFRGTVKFKNRHYVKEGDVAAATITNGTATAYGDEGGVSRYLPNFYSEEEFREWLDRLLSDPEG